MLALYMPVGLTVPIPFRSPPLPIPPPVWLGWYAPTRRRLASADAACAADVTQNAKVVYAELLKSFVPAARRRLATCESAEDMIALRVWSVKVMWYVALRRVGLQPTW